MHIGNEVRRLREERGWTGFQLAVKAGMTPSAVSQIETGKRTPSSASVAKLAEALGVEPGDLYPQAQLRLPDPPEASYIAMPPEEFDEHRRAANDGEIDGAKFHGAVLHAYNAAEADYKRLREIGAAVEDLEEAAKLYREARKRWRVVMFDRVEETIALDERRDPEAIERADSRTLSLDDADAQIRGVLGARV